MTSLGLVVLISASYMWSITRLPRESIQDVGVTIRTVAPLSAPVFAYVPYPRDLEFYLGRPWRHPERLSSSAWSVRSNAKWSSSASRGCCRRDRSLHAARGTRNFRFEQYARGEEVNVWLIPPVR